MGGARAKDRLPGGVFSSTRSWLHDFLVNRRVLRRGPRTAPVSFEPYIADYRESVSQLADVTEVWCRAEGGRLHFYTLTESDAGADSVFEAELRFHDRWGFTAVSFHVFREKETFQDYVAGARLV